MQQLIETLLEAGRIKRCHNLDIHGTYTVGRHSYGVATILLLMHPNPSLDLIRAALWHDAPERYLGDLPAPAKWYNADLSREYGIAETKVLEHMGLGDLVDGLTDDDQVWLHAADRLELLYWCRTQWSMGNALVANVFDALQEWARRSEMPDCIRAEFESASRGLARTREDIR